MKDLGSRVEGLRGCRVIEGRPRGFIGGLFGLPGV